MGKADVCDWLRAFLADGPRETAKVRAAARAAGYTRGDLREARFICGVATTNNATKETPATEWYWELVE